MTEQDEILAILTDMHAKLDAHNRAMLPDGVHWLSQESMDIMQRIAERSAALDRHFTKRVS